MMYSLRPLSLPLPLVTTDNLISFPLSETITCLTDFTWPHALGAHPCGYTRQHLILPHSWGVTIRMCHVSFLPSPGGGRFGGGPVLAIVTKALFVNRCLFASFLTIVLQTKLVYLTSILEVLTRDLMEQSSNMQPKLMLRRTESVVEKLLTNWMSVCLSGFLRVSVTSLPW